MLGARSNMNMPCTMELSRLLEDPSDDNVFAWIVASPETSQVLLRKPCDKQSGASPFVMSPSLHALVWDRNVHESLP